MATHSSIVAWEIPRTEEPGGLQCMESLRVRHDLATKQQTPSDPVPPAFFFFITNVLENSFTLLKFNSYII